MINANRTITALVPSFGYYSTVYCTTCTYSVCTHTYMFYTSLFILIFFVSPAHIVCGLNWAWMYKNKKQKQVINCSHLWVFRRVRGNIIVRCVNFENFDIYTQFYIAHSNLSFKGTVQRDFGPLAFQEQLL